MEALTLSRLADMSHLVLSMNLLKGNKNLQEDKVKKQTKLLQVTKAYPSNASPKMAPKCWVQYMLF